MKQNANPFKRQHPYRRMMTLAAPPQLLIQGFGPLTPFAGVVSKFMESFAAETSNKPNANAPNVAGHFPQ